MLPLILHIVFSSAFILLIKWAQIRKTEDELTIGAINYIVAAITIAPVFLLNLPEQISAGAIWTGSSMGLIYFLTYFLVIFAVRKIGAASTTVVSTMSILVPIVFAAIYYLEMPSGIQTMGIALALVSLTLIGFKSDHESSAKKAVFKEAVFEEARNETLTEEASSAREDSTKQDSTKQDSTREDSTKPVFDSGLWVFSVLVIFFLFCGLARIAQEAFKHVVEQEQQTSQRATFGLAAFVTAAIPSLLVLIFRRKKFQVSELAVGGAMGITNILQTLLILAALQQYHGFIVFPIASAGSVVLVAVVASFVLRESLTRRTILGISISVLAVFLLQ